MFSSRCHLFFIQPVREHNMFQGTKAIYAQLCFFPLQLFNSTSLEILLLVLYETSKQITKPVFPK
jgi:hypothetical protein